MPPNSRKPHFIQTFRPNVVSGDPPDPPGGSKVVYMRASDDVLVVKDDTGTVVSLEGSGGGGAPSAHATSHQPGGSDALAVDAAAATGSLRTLGTSSTSAAAGDDARFFDDRTPTTHASTHLDGADPVVQVARAVSMGMMLDSTGLLDLSMAVVLARFHFAYFAPYSGLSTQFGQPAPSALGTGATTVDQYSRRTSTGGGGYRQDTRWVLRSGGFLLAVRFKLPSSVGARRILIGYSSATTTDTDTTAGSFIGWMYSQPRGDAGWMPCSNDGSTQTLGTAGSAPVADVPYMAVIYQPVGGSTVYLEMIRLDTGARNTASVTATLPATSTALGWCMVSFNQAVSKDTAILSVLQANTPD